MSNNVRSRSIFRPEKPVDQSALKANRALVEKIDRRSLLRGAISLGALSALTGCDVTDNNAVETALLAVSKWNDRVQSLMAGENNSLVIAMLSGVRQFTDGKLDAFRFPAGERRFPANEMLRDREGGLWIGTTDRGLSHE